MTYSPPDKTDQPAWGSPDAASAQARAARGPIDPSAGTDDRLLAALSHLSPVIAAIVSVGTLSWLGPLILWFLYKDRNALVRNASASSFNFHITVWLATAIGVIMCITVVLLPVGVVLIAVAWIAQIVLSIVGALRAWNGEMYRYPYQVPLLRG